MWDGILSAGSYLQKTSLRWVGIPLARFFHLKRALIPNISGLEYINVTFC
jgi:hypothetical protein